MIHAVYLYLGHALFELAQGNVFYTEQYSNRICALNGDDILT